MIGKEYRERERDRLSVGLKSPKETEVEDDLVQAFARLDLQIMSYMDPRPPEVHRVLKEEGNEAISNMPTIFSTVEEARLYWELVQRRTSHFIATAAVEISKDGPVPRKSLETEINTGTGDAVVNFHAESDC